MNPLQSFIYPTTLRQQNDALTLIANAKDFFSPEECARIIELSQGTEFKDGTVGQGDDMSRIRASDVTCLRPNEETQWFFEKLGMAINHMNHNSYHYHLLGFYEGGQIANYSVGGKYDWHIDIGQGENSTRKLSMSVQLSDPDTYEGGDLEFINVNQSTERGIGSLIVFPSFLTHRVAPVTAGNRYSLVAWVHGNHFC